jgi:hypothetical protein
MFKLLYAQRLHVWAAEIVDPTDFDEPHYETGAVAWKQLPQQINQLRSGQQWIFEQFVAAMQQKMLSDSQS